jgi:predicted metal-dependent hydrolase
MGGGYVRLKHTLAELALAVIVHRRRSRTAAALLAYAGQSRGGSPVPAEFLAGAAGMPVSRVRRTLMRTGLFTAAKDGASIALATPFQPHAAYFCRQVTRLAEARRLLETPAPRGTSREVWRGAALFNAGLYFECHEYLEDVWRRAQEPDRTFYHGLVQAAAGCYHLEKGNAHGAEVLIEKAAGKLRPYGPAYHGLDVAGVLAGLRRVLEDLPADLSTAPRNIPVLWKMA